MTRGRRAKRPGKAGAEREAATPIRRYFLGEISADSYLRIIGDDSQETVEARASRARVMEIYTSALKLLNR